MNQRYHRNFHKWFILALFSTIIIFGIAVYRYFLLERERFKENIKRELTFIADLKKKQITAWGDERLSDINFIFNYEDVPSQIKRMKNKPTSEIGKKQMTEWMFAMFKNGHYLSMHAFDVRGDVLISIPDTSVIHLEVLQKEFRNAYANRSPIYSDLQKDKEGKIVMHMVAPIKEDSGKIIGFVVLCIDPYRELYPLIQSWPVPSATSEALLIEQVGDEILFMNELRHKEGSALELRLPVSDDRLPAAMAVNKGEGFVEGNDYRQVPVFAAVSKINGSPWFLIVKIDKDEVYEPLYQDTRNRFIIAVLFAAVIILIGREFWSRNKLKYQRSLLAAEQERQALLVHFDYLFKYANDIIILADRDFNIIEVNDRACQMYGYTRQEFLRMNIKNLYSQTQAKELKEQLNLFTHQESRIFESVHRRKDGTEIPVEVSTRSFEIEGKRFSQSIIRDISERKEAEKKIHESEERYRQIFDSSLDAVLLTSPDGVIYSANPAACRLFGRSEEEICKIGRSGIIDIKDPRLEAGLQKRAQTGIFVGELTGVRKDGSKFPIELSSAIFYDAEGRKRSSISIRDISERKKAEKAMQESEGHARALLDAMPDLMFRLDREGRFLDYKAEKSDLYYQSEQNLIGKKNRDIAPPEFADLIDKNIKQTLETKEIQIFEYQMQIPKQGLRHYEARMVYSGKDEVTAVVRDITERKHTEEKLFRSEEKYRLLVNNINELVYIVDVRESLLRGRLDFVSAQSENIVGYTPEEFLSDPDVWFKSIHPDDVGSVKDITQQLASCKSDITRVYRVKHKILGEYRWLEDRVTAQCDAQGNLIKYFGVARDITDRIKAEEALRQSEEKFRRITENISDIVWTADLNFRLTYVSPSVERMMGESPELHMSRSKEEKLPLDSLNKIAAIFKEEMNKEKDPDCDKTRSRQIEVEHYRADGSKIWISMNIAFIRDENGRATGFYGVTRDISERKKAEEALKESEVHFKNLADNGQALIWASGTDKKCIFFNKPWLEFTGRTIEQELGDGWAEGVHPDDLDRCFKIYSGSFDKRIKFSMDYRLKHKSGEYRWIQDDGTPLYNSRVEFIGYIGHCLDITERKRIEEELKLSEERFKLAINNSPVTIFSQDKELRYTWIYHPAPGFKTASVIGKTDKDLLPEDDAKVLMEMKKRVIKEDRILRDIVRTTINGTPLYYDLTVEPTKDEDGNITGVACASVDITERKLAEDALRERDIRLRKLSSQVPGMIYQFLLRSDGTFCVPFTSEGIKEVFGCNPEDVKDDYAPIIDVILPEDRKIVYDTIRYSAERMTPWFCEFRVRVAGQAVKWIWGRSTPERLSDGSIIWHGFISDITEEKRIEEKLRESELRFRSIYENSTIGLYRTTPAGVFLMANPALVKMLGYPSFDELAKINLERNSFLSPEQRAEFVERIEKDGELTGYESAWTRFDGNTIYVLENARAIRDSHGITLYYDGSVEDITERKLFEEQMKQMQKLEGLGTLASGIAHDFNNILGIILAYVTGIKRAKNDAVKTETAVDTITKAVQRGKTLVQQILAFARKTETNIGPVNVNDIVMEIMVMILETFPKTINYKQNFNKSIPFINADRSQIHQVLLNLCVNARDAMPEGGILSINTDMVPSEYLKDKHQNITKGDYVCIEVSDTGHGMSEAVRKRIFEPFFTTKEIGKGTGLGLSVVFGVVQSHNGFIDVESQEGKGTSFKIYLPMLSTIIPVKEKKVETYEDISGGNETLLVVEDEEALLTSLQMMLDEKGYNVLTAGDGITALNIFKEKKNEIDLVVTDFGLPGMTGLEFSRQIKSIKSEQPLILATGYLDPDMKSELQRSGVMHFLFKPYEVNEVLKTVREVIDKK